MFMNDEKFIERAGFFQQYFSGKPQEYVESEFAEGLNLSILWVEALNCFVRKDGRFLELKKELEKAAVENSDRSVRLIDLKMQVRYWIKSTDKG